MTFRVVHGWPQLPFNAMLNEVSAVAVDSHEHVFVLTRGGRKWPDEGPKGGALTKHRADCDLWLVP